MTIKEIRVGKELLVNLGNFSSIKIIAELTIDNDDGNELSFDKAWEKLNATLAEQETLEKEMRLPKVTNSKIF